jgi:hypothetical protein
MGTYLTLIPAYGRDYKSKAAVMKDWKEDKNFVVANLFDPWDGKLCNKEDLERNGSVKGVNIRYDGLRKIVVVKV